MKFSAVRIFRVSIDTVDRFYDRLCALADRGGKGLHRLLNRYIDLDELRPQRRRGKSSYHPEIQTLETRMVPTLVVLASGGAANAGQTFPLLPPMPPADEVGYLIDPAGYHGPYAATIAWGDGTSSPGTVQGNATYAGVVFGQHIYQQAGTYTETISVVGDGDSGSGNGTVTINAPSPSATPLLGNTPQNLYATLASSVDASLTTGGVQTSVSLGDGTASVCGCTDPGLSANYDGDTVGVFPTIQATYGTSSSLPSSIAAQLTWAGTAQATITYSTSGDSAGDVLTMDVQSTAQVTASGAYSWSLSLLPAGALSPTTLSGTAYIDVSSASEGVTAGNGWTISGVSRLIATTGGVEWKNGEGLGEFFAGSSGTFTSPPGDFGTLTKNFDGTYTYVAKGGLYTLDFDSNGYQTEKITADGQVTTFTYSGGELTSITTPDTRIVTFLYDGSGNMETVELPGGGLATLTHDGSGNLTSIERADSTFVTFAYDTNSRLTVKQTPDTTTTFTYSAEGMLQSLNAGLGDTPSLVPLLQQGISAAINASENVASVDNALGATTTITLDAAGQPNEIQTPDGNVQQFLYDSNFDQLITIDGLGRVTQESYDSSGDQTSVTDPTGATTTTTFDATLHLPTSIENPLGQFQTFTYSGTGDLLTSKDATGAVTTYTWSGGLLQTTTDPLNHTTSYVYDGDNDLIAVIAPTGLRTSYTYDSAGNRTSVEQPDATITTRIYDSMNRPIATVHPDGSRTSMTYDGDGNVVSRSDARGNLTTTVYDADERPVATVDDLGNRTTTVYDNAGETIATIDPYGNRTSYVYDSDGRQVATEDQYGHFTTNIYDAAGELVATVDPYGNRSSFVYDQDGRQVSTEDQYGHFSTNVYDAAGELIATVDMYGNRVTMAYDAAGRQVSSEDQYGHFSTTVYDAAGNVTAQIDMYGNHTTYIYDTYGRQVAVEDQYGHFTTTVFDSYGRPSAQVDVLGNAVTTIYDGYGRVEATVDALGNRTTFSYDSYGEQVSVQDSTGYVTTVYDSYGRPVAQVDQLGDRTTTVYDSHGNVQASVDGLGTRTTYIYDTTGRQVATEDARGHYTTTIFDSYGRVSATEDALSNYTTQIYDSMGRPVSTEDASAHYVTTIYDSYGRVAATEDSLGNFVTTLYDSMGRVAGTEDARSNIVTTIYDSYGRPAASEDGVGDYTTTIYDSMGRVAGTENGLGKITTTIYDSYGRPDATVDPLGNRTTTVFDSYGREVATIDPLGNRTTMVLDALGRQVNEIDANSNKTTFVYDNLGRVVEQDTPSGGVATMAYDAAGRLSSETSPNGTRIDYAFDADGNNTGQTWHNADLSTSYVTFVYDNDNNQTVASNSVGTYTLTYDNLNQVSGVQGLWATQLTFTYDAAGNRTVVQDNFGGVTTNVYDANANLTQQKFGGTGLTVARIDLAYDADNQLTGETRYSDLAGTTKVATTSIVYDAAGEEIQQQDKAGGGTNIANYTWTYDNGGRLTNEQLNAGTPVTYAYDADGELTGDGTSTQVYDAEGNRTGTGYSTSAGNELQSDGAWDYSYDASGNESYKVAISGGETWKYGYDTKNELVQAQLWTSDPRVYGTGNPLLKEVDYKYDAWGNLVERDDYPTGTGSPTVTRYAVDGWNPALAGATGLSNFEVWAEMDGSNALQTRYLHGDHVDQLFGRQDAGVAYWYLTDRQGSVRDVLDNSGAVKDAISYSGFGSITSETNSAYRGNYAWTGREVDVETALQYNRARWYDPATGRWQSQDPMGFDAGDSNLFRYAQNSVTNAADQSGLSVTFPNAPATIDVTTKGKGFGKVPNLGPWLTDTGNAFGFMVRVNANICGDTLPAAAMAGRVTITQYIYRISTTDGAQTWVSNNVMTDYTENTDQIKIFQDRLKSLVSNVADPNAWDAGFFHTDATNQSFFNKRNNLAANDPGSAMMNARWGDSWMEYVDAPGLPGRGLNIKGHKTYEQTMAVMVIAKGTDGNQDIGRFTIAYQSKVNKEEKKWALSGDPVVTGSNVTLNGKAQK